MEMVKLDLDLFDSFIHTLDFNQMCHSLSLSLFIILVYFLFYYTVVDIVDIDMVIFHFERSVYIHQVEILQLCADYPQQRNECASGAR